LREDGSSGSVPSKRSINISGCGTIIARKWRSRNDTDVLAAELDLAKGTLYKHFQSKDELYMLLIIRNERMLLEMVQDTEKAFQSIWLFYVASFASS
jgi:hypothetical protein